MTLPSSPQHGRSGLLFATVAALAAIVMTFTGCADDSPAPQTPGTGSQLGATTPPTSNSAATATTPAPNPNAAGGGAGTATSAP